MVAHSRTYTIEDFKWLVHTVFRDIRDGNTTKVWIVGAGASVDSKISGAADLAHRWSCELFNLPESTSREDNLQKWKEDSDLKRFERQIKNLQRDPAPGQRGLDDFLAQRYSEVYARRFSDAESGYNALRKEMDMPAAAPLMSAVAPLGSEAGTLRSMV